MVDRRTTRRWLWLVILPVAGLLAAGSWAPAPAVAAGDLEKLDISLKLIPENAAFYGALLRNREQVEAVLNSRAWAKLRSMPYVQMGLALYGMQSADPDSVPGRIRAALQDPEVKQALDLVAEMLSDEVFFYGDAGFVDFIELMQRLNSANSYGPLIALSSGQADNLDQPELQARMVLATLSQNLDLIKVPDLIVGFRVKDTQAAQAQIDKLEKLLSQAIESEPDLKPLRGRLKWQEVDGRKYLTLSLDGKMVPWDELPLDELRKYEEQEGQVDKVIDRLKQTTLVVAVGLREDYVLLSVGSSTEALARLGKGKSLAGRPELQPLAKFADRPLTAVSYLSERMAARIGTTKEDVDGLLETVNEVLPSVEQLNQEQKERIRKDAAALAEDLKGMLPEPGPMMEFAFMTETGYESYGYNWSEHLGLDGSKPLSLLEHVGGTPILAVIAREKSSPEQYDLMVKWLKKGYGYFKDYALPQMDEEERQKFEKFAASAGPLLERLDRVNREKVIPALEDGQVGLVVDDKLTSKQFIEALPATKKPMPMIEVAVVLGVSDAKLLAEAGAEYREVINGLIDAVRQIPDSDVPEDFRIPKPQVKKTKAGTLYGYPLPAEWGVDKKIEPTFGLSEKVAVVATTQEQAQRLLESKTLEVGGALAMADRARAAAVLFDWAGLVDAATPWVDLGLEKMREAAENDVQADAIAQQVHTVLEVLKVWRNTTAESFFEDNALVTRTVTEIRDIED